MKGVNSFMIGLVAVALVGCVSTSAGRKGPAGYLADTADERVRLSPP